MPSHDHAGLRWVVSDSVSWTASSTRCVVVAALVCFFTHGGRLQFGRNSLQGPLVNSDIVNVYNY